MTVEFVVSKHMYDKEANTPYVSVHETDHPTIKARFFMALVERWGMVSAGDDGEDSGGRQKVKYLSVNEVIQRAADMTDEAWILMQEREGMLVQMPTIAEMQTTIEERSKEKETA